MVVISLTHARCVARRALLEPGELKQSGGSLYARDAIIRYSLMNKTGANWSYLLSIGW